MKKITNTTDRMNDPEEALAFLAMGIVAGGSNAIEMQESRGQGELVKSAQLPTDGLQDPAFAMITVIGPTAGDPMFSDVVLPDGWQKKATDRAMWSDLLDEKGRKRGAIGYKAAFYDRWARLSPCRRYECGKDYDFETATRFRVKDTATGAILFTTNETPSAYPASEKLPREESIRRRAIEDALEQTALAWINEKFPNWQDPSMYWD